MRNIGQINMYHDADDNNAIVLVIDLDHSVDYHHLEGRGESLTEALEDLWGNVQEMTWN